MNTCLVTALLSLVPAKNIRFLEIPHALANLPMNLLVSQLVSVMLAAVKRPLGSREIFVDISSTLKSVTLDFKTPPMPSPSTAYPVRPIALARLSSADICYTTQMLRLE